MGMAAGFQSGIALGKAFKEGQERRRIEGIRTAAPETSQGYTAEQGQQLEAMASAINPETGRPYYNVQAGQGGNYTITPDFTEAQIPRTGMGTDVVGIDRTQLQPVAFNQQRVTDFLGRRFEGELTPDRIEAMRSRAMAEGLSDPRQRLAAIAEATRLEREAEEAPLRRQALETQVEAGKLGLDRTRQELTAGERAATTAKRMDDFNAWRSQNPQAGFAEINAEAQRLGMGVDEQFKVASSLTGIKEQAFKDSQMRIRDLVKNQGLDGLLKAHKESNDLDPGSHFEVIRGKGGTVSLNRVDTVTGKVIQPNVFSGSEAETTAYLNKAAMDPATIIDYTMNLEKNKSAIAAQNAATEASRATTGLRTKQGQMLDTQVAGNAEAQQIRARYDALTPEEQAGPAGQGLIRQFNMANAKAGMSIPLGTAPRGERTTLSPADVTARAKALVESRTPSLSNPKKPMSMTEAITFVEGGMRNPIRERLDAALGDDTFAPPAAGGGTPARSPAAAPAPRQTGSAGIDTSRPRTDVNPVTNLPREVPVSAPNLVNAATRGLDAGQARYVAYLEAKIAARERLTPDETARAKRFGLVP